MLITRASSLEAASWKFNPTVAEFSAIGKTREILVDWHLHVQVVTLPVKISSCELSETPKSLTRRRRHGIHWHVHYHWQ